MTYFFESPLPFLLLGILCVAILVGVWTQTGRRWAFFAAVLAALLTGGLMLLEQYVQTEREKVTATLYEIADLVENNQLEPALRFVHSQAPLIRSRVESEMPNYHFQRVAIKANLEIEFDQPAQPTEAQARFNAVVVLDQGPFAGRTIPRYVEVTFRKEGDAWRVFDYEHHDPRQGFMRQ